MPGGERKARYRRLLTDAQWAKQVARTHDFGSAALAGFIHGVISNCA